MIFCTLNCVNKKQYIEKNKTVYITEMVVKLKIEIIFPIKKWKWVSVSTPSEIPYLQLEISP